MRKCSIPRQNSVFVEKSRFGVKALFLNDTEALIVLMLLSTLPQVLVNSLTLHAVPKKHMDNKAWGE